jgi:phage terminase small subunit
MTANAVGRPLNERQQRFVVEYLIDLNASAAYRRAGYHTSGAAADNSASRLMRDARVKAAIAEGLARRSAEAGLSQQWVLDRLRENHARAMQTIPVLDSHGGPTGTYRYEGAVANRALELLGKHLGMFGDRMRLEGPGGGPVVLTLDEVLRAAKETAGEPEPAPTAGAAETNF